MIDMNEYKLKRLSKRFEQIANSTKEGGYAFAEACFALVYKAREYASRLEANQRNIEKLNNK